MNGPLNATFQVNFTSLKKRSARPGPKETGPGRVPRVARLLALAIKWNRQLNEGVFRDYTHLAKLGRVSTARITQIMNLLLLAPDIQEQILFLPLTYQGRDKIHLRQLQVIVHYLDWAKQRRLWLELCPTRL